MDIAVVRTFLEIANTGSFVDAATNLNLTETAVCARIWVLEEELGQGLFNRTKTGVTVTRAGEQSIRFATHFVQIWERARRALALPPGRVAPIALGAGVIGSNPLIPTWLRWLRREHPEYAITAHIDVPESGVPRGPGCRSRKTSPIATVGGREQKCATAIG
jgi:DNA-binding transcriptional LysR family regulator